VLPGKLRTREHVLGDLGINYVERQVLLCGCSVQRVHSDYGYDLVVSTFNARGEVEPGIVFFQVKATDNLPLIAGGDTISWVVSRRDLRLWLVEIFPVILVVYDARRDRAAWLHLQEYFVDFTMADWFLAGENVSVHLSADNRLNRRSVKTIIGRKNAVQKQLQGREAPDA
jgi:Domain of unknown function (DUF4365)